jgi:lysozyme family protein
MTDKFERCLPLVLHHENGFVNHPDDPGGITNLGCTKATWERWVGRRCTVEDMRALTEYTPSMHWKQQICGSLANITTGPPVHA